jgi:predicted TPR repeat methyltransferase
MPDNSAGEDVATLSRTQSKYVSELKKRVEMGNSWLDIGADIGLLGNALRRQGVTNVDAIEPNIEVHRQLSINLGSTGLIGTDWKTFEINKYEGIAAVHVLDHFEELSDELARVYEHLVPGGYFFAVVHNEKSLLRFLLGTRWPPFCLQHPQLFSKLTLRRTLENHGFTVMSVGRTTNYFSLQHLVSVGSRIFGLPSKLEKITPGFVIPFKFGNIFIIGQKPL